MGRAHWPEICRLWVQLLIMPGSCWVWEWTPRISPSTDQSATNLRIRRFTEYNGQATNNIQMFPSLPCIFFEHHFLRNTAFQAGILSSAPSPVPPCFYSITVSTPRPSLSCHPTTRTPNAYGRGMWWIHVQSTPNVYLPTAEYAVRITMPSLPIWTCWITHIQPG